MEYQYSIKSANLRFIIRQWMIITSVVAFISEDRRVNSEE